ncbi:MAG: penicillin-binding protein 2 [Verrucomicrobiae bacterium]|nr:penicillin-binding protein 2 [Verrucomicrobiae bacterium]
MVVGIANAAVFGGLAARLYDLQVLNGAQQAELAESNRSRTIWLPPMRGRILDAKGDLLAATQETFRVVLYPQRGLTLTDVARIAAELSPRIGVDRSTLETRLAKALRDPSPSPLVLADDLQFRDIAALQLAVGDPGNVVVEPRHQRVYPELRPSVRVAMAHIVGHVGAVDRIALDDDPHLREPGARVGKSGVEAGTEAELRGVAGRAIYEIDARGRHVRRIDERAAIAGRDVTLTVDMALQEAVIATLSAVERSGEPPGSASGAAVIIEIATGAIMAMASTPGFDAAAARAAGPEWRAYKTDPRRPLVNRATTGHYPPGSTFKIVTALAALEAGQVSLKEKIECWGDATYAGHTFRCWNRRGHIATDLHRAVRESCDCYFYEAARRTGIDKIAAMAGELGLGQVYPDAGIAPQRAGLIPTRAWKRSRSSRTGWLLGETILAGIGQGYVLTTPLQLAVMTARIASGRKVIPTIVGRASSDPLPEFDPVAVSETNLVACVGRCLPS